MVGEGLWVDLEVEWGSAECAVDEGSGSIIDSKGPNNGGKSPPRPPRSLKASESIGARLERVDGEPSR